MEYTIAIIIWLFCAMLCLIGELQTPGLFYLLSGVVGSLVGMFLAWWHLAVIFQCMGAIGGTLIAWYGLSRYVRSVNNTKTLRTVVDAMVGKRGFVVRACSHFERGLVQVGGETWSAYAYRDEIYEADELVEVCEVRGCHVVVKRYDELGRR